jgi:hypothetical protein
MSHPTNTPATHPASTHPPKTTLKLRSMPPLVTKQLSSTPALAIINVNRKISSVKDAGAVARNNRAANKAAADKKKTDKEIAKANKRRQLYDAVRREEEEKEIEEVQRTKEPGKSILMMTKDKQIAKEARNGA